MTRCPPESFSEAVRVRARHPWDNSPYLNAAMSSTDQACSVQFYFMLLMLCKAIALTPVLNAGSQEGLEAWRILVLQHEPTSLTRGAGFVARTPAFQLRRRNWWSTRPVRPRCRPMRESESENDLPTTFRLRTIENVSSPRQQTGLDPTRTSRFDIDSWTLVATHGRRFHEHPRGKKPEK